MKTFVLMLIIFSLTACLTFGALADAKRHRRSLLDFVKMIAAATGRNPFDYSAYGCYCGLGGFGTPVDDVDRCCQTHDSCYQDLKDRKICRTLQVYLQSYKTSSPLTCDKNNNKCGQGLCNCDREAALCFKARKYNNKYKNYNKLKCFF